MTSTAAVCAIASMISTPGMIGFSGKWPWKCGSEAVTHLMPVALSFATMSTIRSTMRNG